MSITNLRQSNTIDGPLRSGPPPSRSEHRTCVFWAIHKRVSRRSHWVSCPYVMSLYLDRLCSSKTPYIHSGIFRGINVEQWLLHTFEIFIKKGDQVGAYQLQRS